MASLAYSPESQTGSSRVSSVRLSASGRKKQGLYGAEHVASWYAATARQDSRYPEHYPEFVGSDRVDVCIIGGGLTGLATALELSERGLRVAVLEANRVAWGASGRNGGQVCSFVPCGRVPYERDLGRAGVERVFAMTREAQRRMAERVERYKIECDLRHGYYHGCEGKNQMRHVRELQKDFADFGYSETTLIEGAEESRKIVAAPRYVGGLLEKEGGHIHPLKYCQGMADAILKQGGALYENSPVLGWQTIAGDKKGGRTYQIYCHKGDIIADNLIIACNAYQHFAQPKLTREILPVGSFIVATRPLERAQAEAILPRDVAVCTYRSLGEYYRRTADNRILFGARANYSGRENVRNFDKIIARMMVAMLPDLKGVEIEYAWGGLLAITARRAFRVGRLEDGAFYAHGYSGAGVLLTQVAAHAIAKELAGAGGQAGKNSGDFALLEQVRAVQFPGGRLMRKPLMVAGGLWMQIQDLRK